MRLNVLAASRSAVREDLPEYVVARRYEDGGSERRAIGSANVGVDAYWEATIGVPLPRADVVFVRIERRGPLPDGYQGAGESADLSLPAGELDAVMAVLAGAIAQAKRDGVLV